MLALIMAGSKTFICPECRRLTTRRRCPDDGTPTVPSELVKNPEKMDPFVGKTVDKKFHVEERLARGGMANVYRVVHQKTNAVLALKVLSRILVEDLTAVRRFYKEARLAATLRHPNTVRVFDVGNTDDGACYMAMEFLEGHSLGQEYRSGNTLPVSRVIHITAQILRSLGEAHDTGLVHRDLKPDNVFLINHYGVPDFVKVLDFGIAKAIREDPEQLTQTGTVVGTPRYMSPEQAQGKPLDQRSDLYSLGVILYELLAGKPPFNDDVPVRLLMMHINDPPVSLNVIRPDVSAGLCDLVMELLEKEPTNRPTTAAEVLERITSLHIPPWIGHPEAENLTQPKKSAKDLASRQEQITDPHPTSQADVHTKRIRTDYTSEKEHQTTVSQPSVRPITADPSITTDPVLTNKIVVDTAPSRSADSEIPVANDLVVVVKNPASSSKSRSIIWACLLSLCFGVGTFVFWESQQGSSKITVPPAKDTPEIKTSTEEASEPITLKDVQSSSDDVSPEKDLPAQSDLGVQGQPEDTPTQHVDKDVKSHDQGTSSADEGGSRPSISPDATTPIKNNVPATKPKKKPKRKPSKGPLYWEID